MIHYQFGDIDAYRAATTWQAKCQAILPNTVAASGFWADCWSTAMRHPFAARDLQVIDEDPNPARQKEDTCRL